MYPNQQTTSDKIIKAFEQNSKLAMMMVVGLAQGGKTGAMLANSLDFMKHPTMSIPPENIFLITGFSSVEWENQTRARLPPALQPNVFHRNKLARGFQKAVKDKTNVLILIDEVQIAAGKTHTLANVFKTLGYLDVENLLKKKIRIVQFSATPNGTLYDGMDTLEGHYAITKLEAAPGYHGVQHFMDTGRIHQYKPLCGNGYEKDTVEELKKTIEKTYKTPRYHVIRTPTGLAQYEVVVNLFGGRGKDGERKDGVFSEKDYGYVLYDMEHLSRTHSIRGQTVSEIDYMLRQKPTKHIFILLKEKARCSKTFQKEHIGVWYERYTETPMDDVIVQGLLGRAGGYDDPGDSIIYTCMRSAEDYLALWNSDFDRTCEWTSRSTTKKDAEVTSRGTWVSLVDKKSPPKSADAKSADAKSVDTSPAQ